MKIHCSNQTSQNVLKHAQTKAFQQIEHSKNMLIFKLQGTTTFEFFLKLDVQYFDL
jgi:hypothetical protein